MLLAERRLQYERDISEVRTVEDPPEPLQPDGPLADVLVPVCVTAGRSVACRTGVCVMILTDKTQISPTTRLYPRQHFIPFYFLTPNLE